MLKLADALKLAAEPAQGPAWPLFLACGFEPLHLATFLRAHLTQRLPVRRVEVSTGLFGDLVASLEALSRSDALNGAVVIEWADLDPRLGFRRLGGWGPRAFEDAVAGAAARCERLRRAISQAADGRTLAVSLPTLPLAPLSHHARERASRPALELLKLVSGLAAEAAGLSGVRIVDAERLDELSPTVARLDLRSELAAGFPFSVRHASVLADFLARLLVPGTRKKGLVTDLDGTLWRGILGDDGLEKISWSLEEKSHGHALYQQLLQALAEAGILLAIVSKNDPGLVEEALRRADLVLDENRIFPFEVGWGPKSEGVARVLAAWNVSPDAIVFVDDSPMELAEVQARFPEIEALLFPTGDEQALLELFSSLRTLFGVEELAPEDEIRSRSLTAAREMGAARTGVDEESFLGALEGVLEIERRLSAADVRPLELLNKTNQFNLNGERLTASELAARATRSGAIFLAASYHDRFGPLGKISVVVGERHAGVVRIDAWVMSCRAFSRRIEHRLVRYLFESTAVERIEFAFRRTPRNGPLCDFLSAATGTQVDDQCTLTRDRFEAFCPTLHHQLREMEASCPT